LVYGLTIRVSGRKLDPRGSDIGSDEMQAACTLRAGGAVGGRSGFYHMEAVMVEHISESIALSAAVLLLAVVSLGSGCATSDIAGAMPAAPTGHLVSVEGCKVSYVDNRHGHVPCDKECIQWTYERGTLTLKHANAAFNCCCDIDAGVLVEGDTISIEERDIGGHPCECCCLFDLTYEIQNIPPGLYWLPYLSDVIQIDLRRSPRGSYCMDRDHYPWCD
jgi:hypothetical protein